MNFENETGVQADYTTGYQADGRELVTVIIKATYRIPAAGGEPELLPLPEQVPLTDEDEFTGEPGYSAPVYECDYAHFKPQCDVMLVGSAYAPPGAGLVRRVAVGLRVGTMVKSFDVVGDRRWRVGIASDINATRAGSFEQLPISYDRAFGGVDDSHNDPNKLKTCLTNPVGKGYWHHHELAPPRSGPRPAAAQHGGQRPSGHQLPGAV